MPTSPGIVRLAASSMRSLASTAFDSVREAVLVVNARARHLPIVLANAAARGCFSAERADEDPVDLPLYGLLAPTSACLLGTLFDLLSEQEPTISRVLTWRLARGSFAAMTEAKLLTAGEGQRLIMLTFAPQPVEREIFRALDHLPVDLMILDRELRVIYANSGAVVATGEPSGVSIVGVSALELSPTRYLPPDVLERALHGSPYHDDSFELIAPPAPPRYLEMDVRPIRDADGVVGLLLSFAPVSERRKLGSLQDAGKHRLKVLTENAWDIVTVANPEGRLLYVSAGVRNALGYSAEERHLSSIFDQTHPDDVASLEGRFKQLVAGEIERFALEYRLRHQDGTYRWVDAIHVSALDDPMINGVVINSRDITERKEAEGRLAQREEVFRLAGEAVDGIIYEWDIAQGVAYRSSGVFEVLGIEPEELPPSIDAWRERLHPLDLPDAMRKINLALIHGRGWTITYRMRDARGRYRSMLERALIQRNAQGDPVRAIGSTVDISEIRRLTDLLAETQRIAQTGGWEYSYATRELAWTEEMYRIYDASPQTFAVSWESMLAHCTPESRQRFHEACVRAEAGGHFDLELEIATLKNRRIWVRMIGHLETADGHPVRAFGSMQKIQAQKLAQIALQHSMGWLKLSMSMAHLHAWRWDKGSDELEFAIVEGTHINLPNEYPTLEVFFGRLHPQDRAGLARAIEHAFKYHREVTEEFRLRASDGSYRSYATVARPLFDEVGAPQGLVGITQDVTARRESEAQLRRSEQLLRVTTTNTADTLMLIDNQLKVRFINRDIGGSTTKQIVGRDIAELLPSRARDGVITRLKQVLASGETANHEFECKAAQWDGSGDTPQFLEYRAVLVRDEGTPTGISISVRNITERKRLEQEILEVATRERNAIGRDLHDGLGQELTGVALMLRGLATRVRRDSPDAVAFVNEIVMHVNQSIESARSLARGLLPVRTDSGGLPFALKTLAGRSRDLYGLDVNFRADVRPDTALSEASASHLYRIAQEALTNAARHGRASSVQIVLSMKGDGFSLCITDDGAGIGVSDHPVNGMGLKIMRYRAGMIGAKFEIGPNVPHGTVVRVVGEQSGGMLLERQNVN